MRQAVQILIMGVSICNRRRGMLFLRCKLYRYCSNNSQHNNIVMFTTSLSNSPLTYSVAQNKVPSLKSDVRCEYALLYLWDVIVACKTNEQYRYVKSQIRLTPSSSKNGTTDYRTTGIC